MAVRNDILKLLVEREEFISGEDISDKLGISRAAVWKNIKTLKEDGGIVEAQTNKGYKLVALPDLLKPEYLNLYTDKDAKLIAWMESVDSTNTYAKKAAREGAPDGLVVVTENQTGGKGRLGRGWSSNPGEAVTMSFLRRPNIRPEKAPALNLVVALGIAKGIQQVCGIDAGIKWPNDIVYEGKKLCGILLEMSSDMDSIEYVVCGAGTNVNQKAFPKEIRDKATSLRLIKGAAIDRVRLCAAFIDATERYFDVFLSNGIGALLQEYCSRSAILNNEVRVLCGNEEYIGACIGFGENGELIVKHGNEQRVFHAGEVSVRGVNGYV